MLVVGVAMVVRSCAPLKLWMQENEMTGRLRLAAVLAARNNTMVDAEHLQQTATRMQAHGKGQCTGK